MTRSGISMLFLAGLATAWSGSATRGYAQAIQHQITLPAGETWCDDSMINGLLMQINSVRAKRGESPLVMDTLGMKDAELRVVQAIDYVVNTPPNTPGYNPHSGSANTAASIGYNDIGENLAWDSTDPAF